MYGIHNRKVGVAVEKSVMSFTLTCRWQPAPRGKDGSFRGRKQTSVEQTRGWGWFLRGQRDLCLTISASASGLNESPEGPGSLRRFPGRSYFIWLSPTQKRVGLPSSAGARCRRSLGGDCFVCDCWFTVMHVFGEFQASHNQMWAVSGFARKPRQGSLIYFGGA